VPETEVVQLEIPGAPATRVQAAAGVQASPDVDDESATVPDGLDFAPEASTSVRVTVTEPG
jgi:hypothetical protein